MFYHANRDLLRQILPNPVAVSDLINDGSLGSSLEKVQASIEAVDKHLWVLHVNCDEVDSLGHGLVTIVDGELNGDSVGLREGVQVLCRRPDLFHEAIRREGPQRESPNEVGGF